MNLQTPNPFAPPLANLVDNSVPLKEGLPRFILKQHKWALKFAIIFSSPLTIFLAAAFMGLIYKHRPISNMAALSFFTLPSIIWISLVTCHWAKEDHVPLLYQSIIRNLIFGLTWLGPFFICALFGLKLMTPSYSTQIELFSDGLPFLLIWLAATLYAIIIERVLQSIKKKRYSCSKA